MQLPLNDLLTGNAELSPAPDSASPSASRNRRSVLEQSLESDPFEGEPNGVLGAFIRPCIKGSLASVSAAVTPPAAGDLICGFPVRAGGARQGLVVVPATPATSPVGFRCGRGVRDPGVGHPPCRRLRRGRRPTGTLWSATSVPAPRTW